MSLKQTLLFAFALIVSVTLAETSDAQRFRNQNCTCQPPVVQYCPTQYNAPQYNVPQYNVPQYAAPIASAMLQPTVQPMVVGIFNRNSRSDFPTVIFNRDASCQFVSGY